MASKGQNFNQVITLASTPEQIQQAVVAAVAGVTSYTVTTAGLGALILTRKYRPTWVIVVAVIGLLFFLIGLLALLIVEKETLTITTSQVDGGTRVSISGTGSQEMLERLTAVLGSFNKLN